MLRNDQIKEFGLDVFLTEKNMTFQEFQIIHFTVSDSYVLYTIHYKYKNIFMTNLVQLSSFHILKERNFQWNKL